MILWEIGLSIVECNIPKRYYLIKYLKIQKEAWTSQLY